MTATKPPTRSTPERTVVSDALRREIAQHAAESLRMEEIEVSQEQQLAWEQRGPSQQ
ncbi:hypothetical protein GCM10022631_07250 [Deinococcus rubellus]|uniref:hypothetical protein n=1 Tax=Deinococcus rubellus TaxID=1889240 RepID=UPI0031F1B7BF